VSRDPLAVFVNVPFDPLFAPLIEALVFTITACGYRVRCALEENDSGDIRLDKLARLIGESPRSIHDLSRIRPIDPKAGELPRFNMPFELGMAMGAKRFGGKSHKSDRLKIMVEEPYRLPAYLSDLGGNDPDAHHGKPGKVVSIVRDFLDKDPAGKILPGPAKLAAAFDRFTNELPGIARGIGHQPGEVGGFKNYRTFLWCIAEFLKRHG
jgi:hypothetical protein